MIKLAIDDRRLNKAAQTICARTHAAIVELRRRGFKVYRDGHSITIDGQPVRSQVLARAAEVSAR